LEADNHTYFVGCEEWGFSVWAHNAPCVVELDAIADAAEIAANGGKRFKVTDGNTVTYLDKVPGKGSGSLGTASQIGDLSGLTRAEIDAFMNAMGATKKVTAGGYTHYYFPGGSQVFIRPNGQVGRVAAPVYDPVTGQQIKQNNRLDQNGNLTTDHNAGEILPPLPPPPP
jgi:hypothetical protein